MKNLSIYKDHFDLSLNNWISCEIHKNSVKIKRGGTIMNRISTKIQKCMI
jgi:hypothetical protein